MRSRRLSNRQTPHGIHLQIKFCGQSSKTVVFVKRNISIHSSQPERHFPTIYLSFPCREKKGEVCSIATKQSQPTLPTCFLRFSYSLPFFPLPPPLPAPRDSFPSPNRHSQILVQRVPPYKPEHLALIPLPDLHLHLRHCPIGALRLQRSGWGLFWRLQGLLH